MSKRSLTFKVNTNKIKGLIVEKGLKQDCVAEEIGLNGSTFNLKINNKRRIYLDEVAKLCVILDITTPAKLKECFNLDFLILQNSRENAIDRGGVGYGY